MCPWYHTAETWVLRTALCPEAGTGENRVRLGNGTLNQRHSFAAPETQNAAEVDPPQFTPAWCQLGVQYTASRGCWWFTLLASSSAV